jgi:transposase
MVLVMDKVRFHKSPRLKALIEGAGCELLFLPPYRPDLKPIEGFCSWLKAWIRRLNLPHLHITQKIEKLFTKLEV